MTKIQLIEKIVCEFKSIDPAALHTRTKKAEVKESRHIVMYIAMVDFRYSERRASSHYGQSAANANHLKKCIRDWMDTDKIFAAEMERLRNHVALEMESMMARSKRTYIRELQDKIRSMEQLIKSLQIA